MRPLTWLSRYARMSRKAKRMLGHGVALGLESLEVRCLPAPIWVTTTQDNGDNANPLAE